MNNTTPYIKKGNTISDKEILKNTLSELKITMAMLAEVLNIPVGNLYQISSGRNGISKKLANKIKDSYPKVNIDYLLKGESPILLDGPELFDIATNVTEATYKEVSLLKIQIAQLNSKMDQILEILNKQR